MRRKASSQPEVALVGFDLDIIDLIESLPHLRFLGYLDIPAASRREAAAGFALLGEDKDWPSLRKKRPGLRVVYGMNNPGRRREAFQRYGEAASATICSPLAYISPRALIGTGCVIQHGTRVMPAVRIGRGCFLNAGASVHHESILGDFSILAPGALVLGRVDIGEAAYIGAGAIIREGCRIGEEAVVGAGAVVLEDVPAGTTVVGVPASRVLEKKGCSKRK